MSTGNLDAPKGVERSSSFRLRKPLHLHLDTTLKRRNSLPSPAVHLQPFDHPPLERVRSFHIAGKGNIVNCGDKIRRKYSSGVHSKQKDNDKLNDFNELSPSNCMRVAIIGSKDVGIHTIKKQFTTSEETYMQSPVSARSENEVSVLLDGEEYSLTFVEEREFMTGKDSASVDTVLLVFSIIDYRSFRNCSKHVKVIRDDMHYSNTIFIVANKVDLARKRAVSEKDAQKLAQKYSCKYVETSVVLNHNIDDLLVGIVRQVRQQRQKLQTSSEDVSKGSSKLSKFTKSIYKRFKRKSSKDSKCTDLLED